MQGGPYHDLLHSVLGAYTCYRPDIGYVSDHISSSSSLWQQLKLPSNKRSGFVLLLGSRHVLHRCCPHSQSRGGWGLHHLCQPAQQTLSDGILQSWPRTGEDLLPLSLYPPLHLFFILLPPLFFLTPFLHWLLLLSFSSTLSPLLLITISSWPSALLLLLLQMLKYFEAFEVFFQENLPQLFSHFQSNNLTPDLYLIDWWAINHSDQSWFHLQDSAGWSISIDCCWDIGFGLQVDQCDWSLCHLHYKFGETLFSRIFTLYSKSLPLDVACRVWDVFCRDGEESLFRTALGILRLFEDVLLQMDFIHIAQFLSRLPDDLQSHTLFTAMANTQMLSRNRRWVQVGVALKGGATFLLSDSDYKFPLRCFPHSWRMEVKKWRRMSAHLPEADSRC